LVNDADGIAAICAIRFAGEFRARRPTNLRVTGSNAPVQCAKAVLMNLLPNE
jgi:hypothetical protein